MYVYIYIYIYRYSLIYFDLKKYGIYIFIYGFVVLEVEKSR